MLMPLMSACSSSPTLALSAPEHEAENGVVGQCRRCRRGCGWRNRCWSPAAIAAFRAHQLQPGRNQQRRETEQRQPAAERRDQRPPEDGLLLVLVSPAIGLRRQPRRRGPQEVEAADDQVEQHRADRKSGKRLRLAHPADDGGVRQPEQRRRHEAERHRHGDRQHQPVRHVEWHRLVVGPAIHACLPSMPARLDAQEL